MSETEKLTILKGACMKKIIVVIAGLALLANVAYAQHNQRMQMRGKGIVKILKLTEEQEKKFDELNYQHQKAMVDLKAKIEKNQIELKKMIQDENIIDSKLLQLTGDNSKIQAEMKELGVKKWIEINKMLDKDQKEIWAKHLGRMGAGMKMIKERVKEGARKMMMERGMRNNNRMK